MKGKYLYGVIKKDENQNLSLDGLSAVTYQSLTLVVEEKEVKDYHKLPKEETVRELISHQQIIEKIMEHSPILPVKFGTILKDEEEVTAVLERGYYFLRNTLRTMEDKIELDLVCFWNAEKAAQMAFQESKKVKNFYKKITSQAKTPRMVAKQRPRLLRGEGVEDKIALGKLVAQYLGTKKEKLRNQILKTLKKEAIESCSHALADVNMLLNQAFLVEKKGQESFNHTLNILDSKFADLLNFRLVGPLPPYSFSTVVIEKIDPHEVEEAKKTLGLNGDITAKTVSEAYRRLAQEYHPDKHAGQVFDSEDFDGELSRTVAQTRGGQLKFDLTQFELINSAYRVLKDFTKRGFFDVDIYHWEGQR